MDWGLRIRSSGEAEYHHSFCSTAWWQGNVTSYFVLSLICLPHLDGLSSLSCCWQVFCHSKDKSNWYKGNLEWAVAPVIKASLSYQEQARENINRNGNNWCSGAIVYYFKYEATIVCLVNYLSFQLDSNTSSEISSFLSFLGLSPCWIHTYDSADFFPHTDLYLLAHYCILSAKQFDTL